MANVFVNIPVPAANGAGAAVAVSTLGSPKTITLQGDIVATVNIEISEDAGTTWATIATFFQPGKQVLSFAAQFMRANVIAYKQGTANADVSSNDNGALFFNLPVTAGDGVGASINVSTLGTLNTVVVGGPFRGTVLVEISEDGTDWAQCFSFTQPGQESKLFTAQFTRTRRTGVPVINPGLPVVDVGAVNDPTVGAVGTTLQDAYDNSIPALITLAAANGPIQIRDNAVPIGNLFEIEDNTLADLFAVSPSTITLEPTTLIDLLGPTVDIGELTLGTPTGDPQIRIQSAVASTLLWWPTDRTFTASPGSLMLMTNTYVHDYPSVSFAALNLAFEMRHEQAGFIFNQGLIFNHFIRYRNVSGIAVNYGPIQGFIDQPNIAADAAAISLGLFRSFLSQPNLNTIGGGTLTVTTFDNFEAFGQLNTGVTLTLRRGLIVGDMGGTGGTLTTQVGVDIAALARGTTNIAIRIAQAVGTAIQVTGVAPSTFAGQIQMANAVAIRFGTAGGNSVELLRSAAGVLRMISVGGTFNEGLDWDFDPPTNNTIAVTTSTGAGLGFNLPSIAFGTTPADPTANWQFLNGPGARTVTVGGDFARRLFSASAGLTISAALTNLFTDIVNEPFIAGGAGSAVNAGNMLIQTSPSFGTNRYGLLITSAPTGGTLNYAFRQSSATALARFDGRLDINRGIALGGGAAATLGTIGGAGPTAAAQAQWLEIDIGTVAHWIAVWT